MNGLRTAGYLKVALVGLEQRPNHEASRRRRCVGSEALDVQQPCHPDRVQCTCCFARDVATARRSRAGRAGGRHGGRPCAAARRSIDHADRHSARAGAGDVRGAPRAKPEVAQPDDAPELPQAANPEAVVDAEPRRNRTPRRSNRPPRRRQRRRQCRNASRRWLWRRPRDSRT